VCVCACVCVCVCERERVCVFVHFIQLRDDFLRTRLFENETF